MQPNDQPIITPFPQKVADFRRRRLPLIVWGVAALACAWMLVDRGGRFEYLGLAQALQYEVSASTTGRLDTVLVGLYDEVETGTLLAKLDDAQLVAQIETSNATVRQLTAELNAAKVELLAASSSDRSDWTNNLRRFQTDEEGRRLEALQLRGTIEADEIEEERLALELERASPLLENGLIGQSEHDQIRLLHDEVRERNDENRLLLAETEREYRTAQHRRELFERGLPSAPSEEPVLRPLHEAISVETRRLQEIQTMREALLLRSPVAGQVSQILCRRGQAVVRGEPILTITERAVQEFITYLAESDDRVVQQNTPVLVSSVRRPGRAAESFVVRVGPGLEQMPQRLWRDPSMPDYGRAVVIAAIPGLNVAPGEMINVSFPGDR